MVCSIKSLSEYIAAIEENKLYNCISRGEHKKYADPLCSNILRHPNPECYNELLMEYFSQFEAELSDLQAKHFIAFSQHHGIPTNLLDFSKSPLVSLYFATKECEEYGYVYFIKKDKLADSTKAITSKPYGWGMLEDLLNFNMDTIPFLVQPLSNAFEKSREEMVNFFIETAKTFIPNFRAHYMLPEDQKQIDDFDRAFYEYLKDLEEWDMELSLCVRSSYPAMLNGLFKIYRNSIFFPIDAFNYFSNGNSALHSNHISWFDIELILLLLKYTVLFNYYDRVDVEKGQIEMPFYFSYNPPMIDSRVQNQSSIFVFQPYATDLWCTKGKEEKVRYWQRIVPDFEIQVENPKLIQKELDAIGINRKFIYCDYDSAARYTVDRYFGKR